ncbi:MAG: hypothetical protein ACI8VT_000382 [Saprospiraceae bacterium]|jgi:hypothetical protein
MLNTIFGSAVFVHHLMIKSSIMSWNFKNKKCAFVALPKKGRQILEGNPQQICKS